jgi:hypothetical protein
VDRRSKKIKTACLSSQQVEQGGEWPFLARPPPLSLSSQINQSVYDVPQLTMDADVRRSVSSRSVLIDGSNAMKCNAKSEFKTWQY